MRRHAGAGGARVWGGEGECQAIERLADERHREPHYQVAVLVPCYNEERAVAKVVADFRAALPEAVVYVYDNNSTDGTVAAAREAGAVVRREPIRARATWCGGCSTTSKRIFTCWSTATRPTTRRARRRWSTSSSTSGSTWWSATRLDREEAAYRRGPPRRQLAADRFITHIFGRSFTDILSGYRVFSRRFVKSFPILSGGFEIETELTIHALELELPVGEVATPYYSRPAGSASKLSTWQRRLSHSVDGASSSTAPSGRCRCSAPSASALAIMSVGLAIPIVITYVQEGLVPRLPTAVLSTGLMLLAFLSIAVRLDSRYRDARPARGQAHRLSRACARRARNGGGAETCANSFAPTMPC